MTWKVGPALACGNTVVVKPSEDTPSTATLLGEVMNKVGVPKGVYNVVHGFGLDSAGAFLTAHPRRQRHHLHRRDAHRHGDHEGRRRRHPPGVAGTRRQERRASCSPTATSTTRSPRSRARASRTAARSAWAPSASTCERPIFDKFVAALKAKAEALKPGRPVDPATKIGPLVSKKHQKQGAVLLPEGARTKAPPSSPAAACPTCRAT